MKMFVKGISTEDFSENFVGRRSNNYTSEEPMNFLGRFSNTFASKGSPIFYRNSGVCFQEQTSFVLETVILLAFGLDICEGVGEDSGHGIGHVDIRVGS